MKFWLVVIVDLIIGVEGKEHGWPGGVYGIIDQLMNGLSISVSKKVFFMRLETHELYIFYSIIFIFEIFELSSLSSSVSTRHF